MEEVDKSAISWLHGLQEFFKFQGDETSSNYVDFILKLLYANNPMILITHEADIVEFISMLRKFTHNNIFTAFHKYYREEHNPKYLQDAFSRGQVQSKIWLAEELQKIRIEHKNVLILAGWYGQLLQYFRELKFGKVRVVDLDREACLVSDDIFNLHFIENYRVKAIRSDINDLIIHKSGYVLNVENFKNPEAKIFSETFMPDLIVNTSAEHMDERWYDAIRFKEFENKPIVVIQSNNLFDVEEHINCVHSIEHMKKKYPMEEILYEGELQLRGYKRVMLIGKP
jgi:hypothetical protein